MRIRAPLGQMTARGFLKRHWQKSPCLIRQAFPAFVSPICTADLTGLAGKSGVESRLIMRTRSSPGWRVRHGPFKPKDFGTLPEKNWTLLVQDCDKYLSSLADLLLCFSFIPNWRLDDLMISYATAGGSVGPHVDAYDVFLLQAQGRRRWDITRKSQRLLHKPGLDLKLVQAFQPEHSWILEPGDMLYLPPGVAHHGIALGECLTFSIGFHAPSDAELLSNLSTVLLARLNPESRYADPNLKPANADPGLFTRAARSAIRRRLRAAWSMPVQQLDECFGCWVTETKPWLMPSEPRRKLRAAAVWRKLAAGAKLERSPAARLAWFNVARRETKLFANGRCHTLPSSLAPVAQRLCRARIFAAKDLQPCKHDPRGHALLAELYNSGLLQWHE